MTVAPTVLFDEESFVLMILQMSAVSVQFLQEPVGILALFRTVIIAALEFALTGY